MASRTGMDFARAAAERQIGEWRLRGCSMCGYQIGYVFYEGGVGYDAGCHCSPRGIEPRTWDDVAAHYNRQTHPDIIAKYDAFWGFPRLADTEEAKP